MASLLGIETVSQIQRDSLRGNFFEKFIIIEALKAKLNRGQDPRLFFYRDSHGNEVDLLIQNASQLTSIEIKSSQTWRSSFTKGIRYLEKLLPEKMALGTVVYGGEKNRTTESYRLRSYKNLKDSLE